MKKIFIFVLFVVMLFSGCQNSSNKKEYISYYWYDTDKTLLFEDSVEVGELPQSHELPKDTDKWDYISWHQGENPNERIAYREPQTTYFIGNVFQIIVKDLGSQPIATGSGFVFNADGWFITNAHVMEGAYYAQGIFNIPNEKTGNSFTYFDINNGSYCHLDKDIYIGKIENYNSIKEYYKDIPINLSYQTKENTYSIGYPSSSVELVLNKGVIVGEWSDLYDKLYSGNSYICSSSYIAPGSSGGILTNSNLEVIGITTLGWTDANGKFLRGASISAFNFINLLQNINEMDLVPLQERFHKEKKVYIRFFNEVKEDAENGLAEKFYFKDGTMGYKYEWQEEGINNTQNSYVHTETLLAATDGWMCYDSECYWDNGDRRTISFYGYYNHQKGFIDFKFEFKYDWGNGKYYTVSSSEINYSPVIALTLNKCVVSSSYSGEVDTTYAKELFNSIYEWLIEEMSRFE